MAIITVDNEKLDNISELGTAKIELDKLCDKAHAIHDSFNNTMTRMKTKSLQSAGHVCSKPFYMDSDANFNYSRWNDSGCKTDITQYGLSQLCGTVGIPSGYVERLYEQDLGGLVETNFRALLDNKAEIPSMRVMESEGVVEAILSEKYAANYPTVNVLEDIREYVNLDKYKPNQVYLSKSRFHIRFVDFDNPVYINGEKLSTGFTVSNSDIGRSALKVNFFLYKFACMNGIVRVDKSGTIYRKTHLGEKVTDIDIYNFRHCFDKIEAFNQETFEQIKACQGKKLSDAEMQAILDTARKNNCPMGQKEREKIIDLAANRYGSTRWGIINGITEAAQDHSLDNRIAYESWAGRLLTARVA